MTDRRPDCVYAILVRDGRVFLRNVEGKAGLPGGPFPPLADHRKHELSAILWDQLGIEAETIWAQGAFEYRDPADSEERFSGLYSVWEWTGDVPEDAGCWISRDELRELTAIAGPLKVLLFSVLSTEALNTS